jgi:hypothetical protein
VPSVVVCGREGAEQIRCEVIGHARPMLLWKPSTISPIAPSLTFSTPSWLRTMCITHHGRGVPAALSQRHWERAAPRRSTPCQAVHTRATTCSRAPAPIPCILWHRSTIEYATRISPGIWPGRFLPDSHQLSQATRNTQSRVPHRFRGAAPMVWGCATDDALLMRGGTARVAGFFASRLPGRFLVGRWSAER